MDSPFLVRRAAAGGALLLALVLLVLLARSCGGDGSGGDTAGAEASPTPEPIELPGGGRQIFPEHRIVAFYGHPADDELGELGIGSPASAGRRLLKQARGYVRPNRPVLPVMELLASVATYDPGPDGTYRRRTDNATIRRYLRAARAIKALLVLDIQPGRAAFLPEAQHLERWLREPDVGLALDPEWHVAAPDVPGQVIGSVDGTDVQAVAEWLDGLTARGRLPQKLFIIHQFTEDMIKGKEVLRPHKNLATVLNADGFGTPPQKIVKYDTFTKDLPWTFDGFKLFYREDVGLMSPKAVLKLRPTPDVIVYE